MSAKQHFVRLNDEERQQVERAVRSNKNSPRERRRARMLLAASDPAGVTGAQVAAQVGASPLTVWRVRKRFAEGGLKRALHHGEQKRRKARRLDGRAQAHLVALTCCAPPDERKRWSLPLRAGKLVAAEVVDSVSHETVRQTLKKMRKPWLKQGWGIPPEAHAEFVAAMEDVLEVYQRPYAAARPPVNLDEAAKQLLADVRAPLPMRPGQPERVDNEYKREGTAAMFMVFEPLAGRRQVFVRQQRTRLDFAAVIKTLCDELYPQAEKIVLVMDQLNTHGIASLYAAYPPEEALRLAQRLEIHHTPKHGSWLNMAGIELSVLARQCLDERMENQERLTRAVAAWEHQRNAAAVRVDWRFTTADARIKLKHLYPSILP